ncbi:MAG: heme lyase CcmF/NrfE family subunit [bacterium]
MAALGHFAVLASLVTAVYSIMTALLGARFADARLHEASRRGALAAAGLLTLASVALVWGFISFDFSLEYVARNTSRVTPLLYRISGFWGGMNGSLLLWAWVLSMYGAVVVLTNRTRHAALMPYVITVLMGVLTFFLVLLSSVASPFATLQIPPPDGLGLNPLLEDPGMFIHPPTLYLGYVGLTVPFAFAFAALLTGRLTDEWLATTRRWALASWYFLGMGMVIGGWWAYHVLGWGGYWGWDPVENSVLMPWLVMTAYLHSAMVQDRRGMLKVWNLALIILAFGLSLFGTFLTRSGVVSSVHSFARSSIGPVFLGFLAAVMLAAFGLLLARMDRLQEDHHLESVLSREAAFLLNNVALIAAAAAVFLGTTFPMLSEALRGVRILVGPPYFNQVFVPIALLVLLLMGVGTHIPWVQEAPVRLKRHLWLAALLAAAAGVVLVVFGVRRPGALTGFILVVFVLTITLQEFAKAAAARRRLGEPTPRAVYSVLRVNPQRYGGYMVHLGVLMMVVGIIASSAFSRQVDKAVAPGEPLRIGRYFLRVIDVFPYRDSTRSGMAARIAVANTDHPVGEVRAAKVVHEVSQQPLSLVGIRSTIRDDLYVILEGLAGERVRLRVFLNPLVLWIWLGAGVVTAGTLVAVLPELRSRRAARGEIVAVIPTS